MNIKVTEVANVYGMECRPTGVMDWMQRTCSPAVPKNSRTAIMPHGEFFMRNAAGIRKHSGLIQIDIDAKMNPHVQDWAEMRDVMGMQPHVLCSSISASGAGIYVLVRINRQLEKMGMNEDEMKCIHRQWAATAMGYVEDCISEELKTEVVLDRKVSNNIASLRFMGSDPDMWVNVCVEPLMES